MAAGRLPHVVAVRVRSAMVENLSINQPIVDDRVGLAQPAQPFQRQKLRVSRSGPNQRDEAGRARRATTLTLALSQRERELARGDLRGKIVLIYFRRQTTQQFRQGSRLVAALDQSFQFFVD